MFLELKNFRSFSKLQLQLPDEGKILLHGRSGCGKTTILDAIRFALWGKVGNELTKGKKKGYVKLTMRNINIMRTKGPDGLHVLTSDGRSLEDAEAQAHITLRLGRDIGLESFFSFLDELYDTNIDKIIPEVKNCISKMSKEILCSERELKTLERYLVDIPHVENAELKVKELNKLLHKTTIQNEYRNEMSKCLYATRELLEYNKIAKRLDELESNGEIASKDMIEYNIILNEMEQLEKDAEQYIAVKEYTESMLEYNISANKVDELERIDHICDEMITFNETKNRIEELEKNIDPTDMVHDRGKIFSCPVCQTKVCLLDSTLVADKTDILEERDRLKALIEKKEFPRDRDIPLLKKKLVRKNELIQIQKEIEGSKEIRMKDINMIKKMLKKKQSSEYAYKRYEDLKERLAMFPVYPREKDIDRLRKCLYKKENMDEYIDLKKRLSSLEPMDRILDLKKLEFDLIKKESIETKIVECNKTVEQIEAEIQSIKKFIEIRSMKKDYDKVLGKKTSLEDRHRRHCLFENICLEAKKKLIVTVNKILNDSINSSLEEMFGDPICFNMVTNKIGKPVVSVTKNDVNFLPKNLSSGEQVRLKICMTLALLETIKSPIFILDESISCLDEITSELVFKTLQNISEGIPVLVVFHQTVTGDFDKVIHVEDLYDKKNVVVSKKNR